MMAADVCYNCMEKAVVGVIKCHLKVYLAMREMTQIQLSVATGIRQPTISAMCTGKAKHIPMDVLNRLCRALNCQPGDLLEYLPDSENGEEGC